MDIMNRLYTSSNEYGIGWKNRCLIVNEHEYKLVFDYLKLQLTHLKLNNEHDQNSLFFFIPIHHEGS